MTYAVFGAGRVGSAIARSLKHADIAVEVWSSRKPMPATRRRTVFLCVPEGVLSEIDLSGEHQYVIVSGSLSPKSVRAARVQTFHPLMGFSEKGPKRLSGVPVGVDSKPLAALARRIGAKPFMLPADRTLYHAACVLGGAGVLAAWSDACRLLAAAGVANAREVLHPIAIAALERQMLTGPVARGDDATIRAHRQAIKTQAPEVLRTYDALIEGMRRI
jgi:predicted short-subunit dehydrogenase-like oxidoreductase (DUF2520 family)